jgi:hypothetical protein
MWVSAFNTVRIGCKRLQMFRAVICLQFRILPATVHLEEQPLGFTFILRTGFLLLGNSNCTVYGTENLLDLKAAGFQTPLNFRLPEIGLHAKTAHREFDRDGPGGITAPVAGASASDRSEHSAFCQPRASGSQKAKARTK